MLQSIHEITIRYDEVDQMGYVYHGNYAKYLHTGRTELLRKLDLCDKSLEKINILLPVIEVNIRYLKPVFYDDTIKIITKLIKASSVKLHFEHLTYNKKAELVNKSSSTVVFVDKISRKPIRISESIYTKLKLMI